MKRYLLGIAFPLYVLDQVTKWLIVGHFEDPARVIARGEIPESIRVIDGFFSIVRVHNTGIAFGRFNGAAYANLFFGTVAVSALALILYFWKAKGAFPSATGKSAATLIIAGILGNLTDRLVHGYVVDFLSFDLQFMVWPTFNVADSCICIAAGLLFLTAFRDAGPTEADSGAGSGERRKPDVSEPVEPVES